MEFSLIICTYNRDKYIYTTLERIAANRYPANRYEIILVNNRSTDRTEEECLRFRNSYGEVPFRYMVEEQQGLSFARNRGVAESRGKYLVFLDDDAFVEPDYLANLEKDLEQYRPDAFGGRIRPKFESGVTPAWMSRWSYSWVSALDMGDRSVLFKGKAFPIGANMGIRRESMPEGGFNTSLGRSKGNLMGGEEKDLFNRMKARKAEIRYFPDVKVEHVIPPKRTTRTYIRELATGIGRSERIRTLNISRKAYLERLLAEGVKWAASLVLFVGYCLAFTPVKGSILIYFRRYVTGGLLDR